MTHLSDGADLVFDIGPVSGLCLTDIHDQIDLMGAVLESQLDLVGFGIGRHGAERKAGNGYDLDIGTCRVDEAAGRPHVTAVDADGSNVHLDGFGDEPKNVHRRGVGFEQCVVKILVELIHSDFSCDIINYTMNETEEH